MAHSWRTQRWDSLRLLTPNWMTRLPGFAYRGDDPDGYLGGARGGAADRGLRDGVGGAAADRDGGDRRPARPVAATSCRPTSGSWHASTVVVATGATSVRAVPDRLAAQVPGRITTVTAADYRNPDRLPDGGVLVVGASASGVQIAEELQRSGRPVTLAVGEHVRMPRTYRGRDILWWMDASGLLDERYDEVPDLVRARAPAVDAARRLTGADGRPQRVAPARGAAGRAGSSASATAGRSSPGRCPTCARWPISSWAGCWTPSTAGRTRTGVDADPPQRFAPTEVPAPVPLSVRLAEIATIVWATGYRPALPWLDVPVFDRRGRMVHDGGVTASPGLYVIGLPFLRRRRSTLIDGAGADARELAGHLVGYLDTIARRPLVGRRAS